LTIHASFGFFSFIACLISHNNFVVTDWVANTHFTFWCIATVPACFNFALFAAAIAVYSVIVIALLVRSPDTITTQAPATGITNSVYGKIIAYVHGFVDGATLCASVLLVTKMIWVVHSTAIAKFVIGQNAITTYRVAILVVTFPSRS